MLNFEMPRSSLLLPFGACSKHATEHRRAGEEWVSRRRYELPEAADRGRGEESHKRQVRPQPARVGSHVRRQYGRSQVHDRALEVCKPAIDHTIWPGCACRSAWIRSAPM